MNSEFRWRKTRRRGAMADDWIAVDKLQHFVACFAITVAVALALSTTSLLRRWRICLGCMVGLMAGAAKEAGDELKLWASEGASVRDAVADIASVLAGALALQLCADYCSFARTRKDLPQQQELSVV